MQPQNIFLSPNIAPAFSLKAYPCIVTPKRKNADKLSTRLSAVCFECFPDLFVLIERGAFGAVWGAFQFNLTNPVNFDIFIGH
jgi:hypothetical protein